MSGSYLTASELTRLRNIEALYNSAKNTQWQEATGQAPVVAVGNGATSSTPLLSGTQQRRVQILEDPEAQEDRRKDREHRAEAEAVVAVATNAVVLVVVLLGPPLLLGGAWAIASERTLLSSLLVSFLAIWGTYLLVLGMMWLAFATLW